MLDAKGWAEVTTIARQAIGKPALDMATDLANKPDNDWRDIMFRPALMQNYNLSVKGGGKYSTYYTGLGYFNQDGIVKGTNYQMCIRDRFPTVQPFLPLIFWRGKARQRANSTIM